jgi:hypothetical protein
MLGWLTTTAPEGRVNATIIRHTMRGEPVAADRNGPRPHSTGECVPATRRSPQHGDVLARSLEAGSWPRQPPTDELTQALIAISRQGAERVRPASPGSRNPFARVSSPIRPMPTDAGCAPGGASPAAQRAVQEACRWVGVDHACSGGHNGLPCPSQGTADLDRPR